MNSVAAVNNIVQSPVQKQGKELLVFPSLMIGIFFLIPFLMIIALFLIAPVLVIVAVSFNAKKFLSFPPKGFSLRWYAEIFTDDAWFSSLISSLRDDSGNENHVL